MIKIADYPLLRRLAWNFGPDRAEIPEDLACALYERNWRFVLDENAIDTHERQLMTKLVNTLCQNGFSARTVMQKASTQPVIYSIGHSNIPYQEFLGRLQEHGITAIADVRSKPHSVYTPQFNHDDLKAKLNQAGIAYVFLGPELGGRPEEPALYTTRPDNGEIIANYRAMAMTESFKTGIARLLKGASAYNLAMMCSERDPTHCHRCLLIGRYFADNGIEVRHIEREVVKGHYAVEGELVALLSRRRRGLDTVENPDPDNPDAVDYAYVRQSFLHAHRFKAPEDTPVDAPEASDEPRPQS